MRKRQSAKETNKTPQSTAISITSKPRDQRDANIEELRESLEAPHPTARIVDHIEHEISAIDVLLLLLEGDVSTLAVANRDPYVDEIRSRLSSMRAYVAMDRLPRNFPHDAAIRQGEE